MRQDREEIWFEAAHRQDLLVQLNSSPAVVPPLGLGETTDDQERWVFHQSLHAGLLQELQGPISVRKGEAPDFRLLMKDGSIGIEVTQLVQPYRAAQVRKLNRASAEGWVETLDPETPRRLKSGQMTEVLTPEESFFRDLALNLQKKAASTRRPGYTVTDRLALVIYDNWQPLLISGELHLNRCRAIATSLNLAPFQEVHLLTWRGLGYHLLKIV